METLTPLSGDRKCFRMINSVLVERTVGDVLPALQTNADNLKEVLETLVKQYRTKQEEMEQWKVSQQPIVQVTTCLSEANKPTEEEQRSSRSTVNPPHSRCGLPVKCFCRLTGRTDRYTPSDTLLNDTDTGSTIRRGQCFV